MPTTTLKKSANAQIQRIQDEVEAIMRDTIVPSLAEIVAKTATSAVHGSKQVREYSDTVAVGVRGRPLISIAVAAAIGFVAGRITGNSRNP
jgi:ElaB/YqjD/DUF883 family membrane-anchored ribosome-binding protein